MLHLLLIHHLVLADIVLALHLVLVLFFFFFSFFELGDSVSVDATSSVIATANIILVFFSFFIDGDTGASLSAGASHDDSSSSLSFTAVVGASILVILPILVGYFLLFSCYC